MAAKNDDADLANEIDALRRMTVKELRRRHVELFGEETRAGNRQYLFRRIACARGDVLCAMGTVVTVRDGGTALIPTRSSKRQRLPVPKAPYENEQDASTAAAEPGGGPSPPNRYFQAARATYTGGNSSQSRQSLLRLSGRPAGANGPPWATRARGLVGRYHLAAPRRPGAKRRGLGAARAAEVPPAT